MVCPFSNELRAFELAELLPDGFAERVDIDLDQEDDDRFECSSPLEIATPGW